MSRAPSILLLSFSDHRTDPRVHRQIAALRDHYDLTTAGICPCTNFPTRHVALTRGRSSLTGKMRKVLRLKGRRFDAQYWTTPLVQDGWGKLNAFHFDVVIANDVATLPLALRLSGEAGKVYLDAHEYTPRQWDDRWLFNFYYQPYWDYICRTYLPAVDYMTTVCEGIAEAYARTYGVTCDVVLNTPDYVQLDASPVDPHRVRMIHHGRPRRSRRLESMIELMRHLDGRFSLDLMLLDDDPPYVRSLRRQARGSDRVRFMDPVPMPEIARTINAYDVGLFLLSPRAFNYRLALPNKLFEFIQGRLAVAIWPSPEMKRVVQTEGVGVVSDEFTVEAMAGVLNGITADRISRYKVQSAHAATRYNATRTVEKIKEIVARLLP